MHSIVVNHNVDTVVHFSALLSAIGEKHVQKALEVSYFNPFFPIPSQGFFNLTPLPCSLMFPPTFNPLICTFTLLFYLQFSPSHSHSVSVLTIHILTPLILTQFYITIHILTPLIFTQCYITMHNILTPLILTQFYITIHILTPLILTQFYITMHILTPLIFTQCYITMHNILTPLVLTYR